MEDDFKEQVRKGFASCKSDINFLKEDNQVIVEKINSLIVENKDLKHQLNDTNSEILELKSQIKAFEIALNYIKDFNKSQNNVEMRVVDIQKKISEGDINVEHVIENKPVIKKQQESIKNQDPYEALLAFKAKANKRDLLKQKILSMVNQTGTNLSELKFMFVDHFKYCSKASFYNYLKELELERQIKVQRQNTKNFVYLMNSKTLYDEI